MKSSRYLLVMALLVAVVFAVLTPACSKKEAPPPVSELSDAELESKARTLIDLLSASEDKSAEVIQMFSAQMAKAFPASQVKQVWPELVSQLGSYEGQGNARLAEESGYKVVYITCSFEKGNLDCKVVFDNSGAVAGLWFLPAQSSSTNEYKAPAYADAGSFTEVQVTVGEGDWQLPGILSLPKGEGPFPAVVLVHGSGPNDMDETVGANKPFKDLAWGLATQGVAVLRYEKRTREHQSKMAELTSSMTVEQETIEDALLAVDLLRSHERIDPNRVFLLGHSLGGMLAPRIATAVTSRPSGSSTLRGVILLAANARSLLDLIEEQMGYLASADGTISAEEAAQVASVKAACDSIRNGTLKDSDVVLGAGRAYWEDLMAYDPVQTAQELEMPLLVLQGERDYQVTMADFELWQNSLGDSRNATLKSYPALNHLFIAGTGKSLPAEYEVPGNVDKAVVDDIAEWIKAQ